MPLFPVDEEEQKIIIVEVNQDVDSPVVVKPGTEYLKESVLRTNKQSIVETTSMPTNFSPSVSPPRDQPLFLDASEVLITEL